MEIDFDPNIRLQSTFYPVPGYETDLHVLTSPTPLFPGRDALSATSDPFKREQILQSKAYYERLPVVLVHGMVVASSYMHDLGRHLAPWFRVFIPDLPGFGRSSQAIRKGDTVSIGQLAQGLHYWIDAAGLQKAHFASNSLGCQVLAEFTRRWPDRVGRLVLQGPTMDTSRQPLFKTLFAMAANGGNEPFSMNGIMIRDYWRAGLRRAFALIGGTAEYGTLDALRDLKHPTLLLSCELDPVTPCSWIAELSENMPNAVHYVLTKAAHTANYSATEKMSRNILRYLLIQDDDGMRRAGSEILEEVMEINRSRETAAKQRSKLLWGQLALGLAAILTMWTGLVDRWKLSGLLPMEAMILYKYFRILPLLSLNPSDHLDRVYVKLQGIADFDSASSMLRAVGRHLHFRDFPQLGVPTSLAAPMPLVNWLPPYLRDTVYSAVGASEAAEDASSTFDAEGVTESVVAHFPAHRKYAAVAIGSTNGALTHLYAAMGIPWLPQTLLMPVKRQKNAAFRQGLLDMTAEMEWGRCAGRALLERNPEVELYHMADPNQDQLMIQHMAYFRLKFIKMTEAYRNFLLDALEPNGTIILVRCGLKWPSTKVADRHYFQSGAVGGLTAKEFIYGSGAVNEFVESHNKSPLTKMDETVMGKEHRTDWNAPSSNCEVPEAEWGYADALTDDIVGFAEEHGFQVKYLDYDHPEHASPLVADAYRQWKEQLHRPTDSILVESFVVMEPWLAIRYNLTPFWVVFPVKPSLGRLQDYLETCRRSGKTFGDGFMLLFCSGVNSVGLVGMDEWKRLLDNHFALRDTGKKPGARKLFPGTDEHAFPKDFGFPARYQPELAREVGAEAQYVMPPGLGLSEFERYMAQNSGRYGVRYRLI